MVAVCILQTSVLIVGSRAPIHCTDCTHHSRHRMGLFGCLGAILYLLLWHPMSKHVLRRSLRIRCVYSCFFRNRVRCPLVCLYTGMLFTPLGQPSSMVCKVFLIICPFLYVTRCTPRCNIRSSSSMCLVVAELLYCPLHHVLPVPT